MTPEKTISRLILYRRLLNRMLGEGARWAHSQELADMSGASAAQVRRDLMVLGYTGTPVHGYDVSQLVKAIGRFLDDPECQVAALVGVGRLGSAILAYFQDRSLHFEIKAAFDKDPRRVGHSIHGCPCHALDRLPDVVRDQRIHMAILAVPGGAAQPVADRLIEAGVRGLVNFAPVPLHAPAGVFVENMDITTTLEKVAFFARAEKPAEFTERIPT